jgi:hypothetical protein
MSIKDTVTIGTGNIKNTLSEKVAGIKNLRRSWWEALVVEQNVPAGGERCLSTEQKVPAGGRKCLHANNDFPPTAGGVCRRTTTSRRQREVFVNQTMTSRRWQEVFAREQRPPAGSRRSLSPNNDFLPVAGRFCSRTTSPRRRQDVLPYNIDSK